MLQRFVLPLLVVSLAGATLSSQSAVRRSSSPVVQVYKSPSCGCCAKWVDHLRANGFDVRVENQSDLSTIKKQHGIPERLLSCHTATVDGYAVEGHVPAADVHRLLKERPPIAGIAVPGMPTGSPGMEVEGWRAERFNVVSFDKQGKLGVFAKH
jgi:hypothetical protein